MDPASWQATPHLPPTVEQLQQILNPGGKVISTENKSDAYIDDLLYELIQHIGSVYKDALALYKPLPRAEEFHACMAHTRLLSGSNRSSKTTSALVEMARLARGMDPYRKLPRTDLRMLILGPTEDHLSKPIYEKLARPGAFAIVKDVEHGFWRAVRPDPNNPAQLDPVDDARRAEWQPAPPLIPLRPKQVAWVDRGREIPSLFKLDNGSEIMFRSSMADLKRGIHLHAAMPDEEIERSEHISELQARLLDKEGYLFWSYTPQHATPVLYALHEMAQRGDPEVREFQFMLDDNPYISASAKANFLATLTSDQERQVRYFGGYALMGRQRYPEFRDSIHAVQPFQIPPDWMRFFVVDPGWQVCATAFLAVKPDCSEVHLYDELYLRNLTPSMWGDALAAKCTDQMWEMFIIDGKAGAQTQINGVTQQAHFVNELMKRGIRSRRTGYGFFFGTPNETSREGSLKKWLTLRPMEVDPENPEAEPPMRPTFFFHLGKCPNFVREMANQWYKKDLPDVRARTDDHLVDTVEYAAAFFDSEDQQGLYYVPPNPADPPVPDSAVWDMLQAKREHYRKKHPQVGGISLGGGNGLVGM